MEDEPKRDVVMTAPDGTITRWPRAVWDKMQAAMRENDREFATALYLSGDVE